MSILRKIEKLNKIFSGELGSSPTNLPNYAWKHSEAFFRPKRVLDSNGPVYDFHCSCGINRRVHDPLCTTLSKPVPRITVSKACPNLNNQWVVARLLFMPLRLWTLMFGDSVPYPTNGDYHPLGNPKGYVCLDPGDLPTEEITWEIIRTIRQHESVHGSPTFDMDEIAKRAKQDEYEYDRLQAKDEAARRDQLRMRIKEDVGVTTPGVLHSHSPSDPIDAPILRSKSTPKPEPLIVLP